MPESPDSQIETGSELAPTPHPAERLVAVKVYEHGHLIKHTVTFVHIGCSMERLVTDQATQEQLPW